MSSVQDATQRIERLDEVLSRDRGAMWRVLTELAESPHRTLVIERPCVGAGDARAIATDLFTETLNEPEAVAFTHRRPHFCHGEGRWRFLKVHDERARLSHDTTPNKVTAHFLRTALGQLRTDLRALSRARRERGLGGAGERAHVTGQRLRRRLQSVLNRHPALQLAPRLGHLPMDNLVLNHHPLYRQVVRAYLEVVAR